MIIFFLTQNECRATWIMKARKISTRYNPWFCVIIQQFIQIPKCPGSKPLSYHPLLQLVLMFYDFLNKKHACCAHWQLCLTVIETIHQRFVVEMGNVDVISLHSKREAELLCAVLLWTESGKKNRICSYRRIGDVDNMVCLIYFYQSTVYVKTTIATLCKILLQYY